MIPIYSHKEEKQANNMFVFQLSPHKTPLTVRLNFLIPKTMIGERFNQRVGVKVWKAMGISPICNVYITKSILSNSFIC